MSTLHMTLKKQWFDMIASGEKKEEYREVKDFWRSRLFDLKGDALYPKSFKYVQFRNGYNPDSPILVVQFKGIRLDYGKQKWGAEKGVKCIVIELGKVIKRPKK